MRSACALLLARRADDADSVAARSPPKPQVLRYGIGQQYDTHQDVGEVSSKSGAQLSASGGHRAITCLLYFTTPEEGGETVFPVSEWADEEQAAAAAEGHFSKCGSQGVAVKPHKGDMFCFWSITYEGKIDRHSLHAGCPVIKGEKWTGTKWIHQTPFRYNPGKKKRGKAGCEDLREECEGWAYHGECEANPLFMVGPDGQCNKSCKKCT